MVMTMALRAMARPGSLTVNVAGAAYDWASGTYSYDGSGNISYDPENHELMTEIRAAKIDAIRRDIPMTPG